MKYGSRQIGVVAALALAACGDRSAGEESAPAPSSEARAVAKPAGGTPPAPAPPGPDLDAVLALTPDCRFGEPLASIFGRMTIIDPRTGESRRGNPIEVPGFAEPIRPTFERAVIGTDHGEEKHVSAELAIPGSWQGMRVSELRLFYLEESHVSSREVRFLEPPERVLDLLNRRGFALGAIGHGRSTDDGQLIDTRISLDRDPGGALLRCSTG
jgi:hypothetical protein